MKHAMVMVIAGTLILFTGNAFAQTINLDRTADSSSVRAFWIGVSMGSGNYSVPNEAPESDSYSGDGFEFGAFISYRYEAHYFALVLSLLQSDHDRATCTALMYGRAADFGPLSASAAIGPGLMSGSGWNGTDAIPHDVAPGATGEGRVALNAGFLQIGLRGLFWQGVDRSYSGVSLSLALGLSGNAP